jgi:hypothetical protein
MPQGDNPIAVNKYIISYHIISYHIILLSVNPDLRKNCSLLRNVQNISRTHPASYSFPGVKRPGREINHSPTASAEVRNKWRYTSTPPYVIMVWERKALKGL